MKPHHDNLARVVRDPHARQGLADLAGGPQTEKELSGQAAGDHVAYGLMVEGLIGCHQDLQDENCFPARFEPLALN